MSHAEHGDLDHAELEQLGVDARAVLDLSVNVSPLGPHPEVLRAIHAAAIAGYPDRHARDARAAIARAQACAPEAVLVGNGAVELIWTLIAACAREHAGSRPLLVVGPTFSEPEAAAHALGMAVVHSNALEVDGFAIDVAQVQRAIDTYDPCVIYLCQPNNPTGRVIPEPALRELLAFAAPARVLLDQSFLSLSTHHAQALARYGDHVVLLRSLTKDHALAGVRAGYALCEPSFAARLEASRPPWSVSAFAQAAIVAALAHPEHVALARDTLLATRASLATALHAHGIACVTSDATFQLVKVDDADAVRAALLTRHRIAVRSARSFGLPKHIRVAAPAPADLPRVIAALHGVTK